jgi:hypothetical protein
MPEQPLEQQSMDLEAKLIEKAMADEAFKRELMSNPKAAIAKELGQELPAELEFEVLEQTPTKLYLVLPMSESEASPSEELAEEQLEAVAGGLRLPVPGLPVQTIFGCLTKGFICGRR